MKLSGILLLVALIPSASITAQNNGIPQSSEFLIIPTGDKFPRWHGHAGRSYFIQVSDAENPLETWSWVPIIESGNDSDISYEVGGTAEKGFYRLKYTDQVPGPGRPSKPPTSMTTAFPISMKSIPRHPSAPLMPPILLMMTATMTG